MIDAFLIQQLADRAAAQQRQADAFMQHQAAGDMEGAHHLDRPHEQQQRLLALQDISDANEAATRQDEPSTRAAITSAVQRQMRGTRLAPRKKVRP